MSRVDETLHSLIEPVVTGMGFELVGVEYVPQGKHSVLRIYIDHADGISVENCGDVSHQVSGVMDVEDPIKSNYLLEVSSPGLDRPLFTAAHFSQFIASDVKVRLHSPLDGRRKFKGTILAVSEEEQITIQVDGVEVTFSLSNVDKANLVPNI